jgi:hypothetical protein
MFCLVFHGQWDDACMLDPWMRKEGSDIPPYLVVAISANTAIGGHNYLLRLHELLLRKVQYRRQGIRYRYPQ